MEIVIFFPCGFEFVCGIICLLHLFCSIGSTANVSPKEAGAEPLHHRHRYRFPRQQQHQCLGPLPPLLAAVSACSPAVPQASRRGHGPLGGGAVRPAMLRGTGRGREGDGHPQRWRRVLQVCARCVGRTRRPVRGDGATWRSGWRDREAQSEWTRRGWWGSHTRRGTRSQNCCWWFWLWCCSQLLRDLSVPLWDPDDKARRHETVCCGGGHKQGLWCHLGPTGRLCQQL